LIKFKHQKKFFIIFISLVLFAVVTCGLISITKAEQSALLNLNNVFTIKIPENINYKKENYVIGNEITQHFALSGKDEYSKISGYIQVWQLTYPIEDYIKQSESNISAAVYDYEKKPVLQNGSTGFEINFKIKGDKFDTQVIQTLWQKGNSMYILSLSSPLRDSNILKKANNELINSVTLTGESLPSGKLTEYCIHCI